MGFKEVEEAFRKYCVKDKKSDEPDNKTELPEGYEEGMTLASVKAEKSTHYTFSAEDVYRRYPACCNGNSRE